MVACDMPLTPAAYPPHWGCPQAAELADLGEVPQLGARISELPNALDPAGLLGPAHGATNAVVGP